MNYPLDTVTLLTCGYLKNFNFSNHEDYVNAFRFSRQKIYDLLEETPLDIVVRMKEEFVPMHRILTPTFFQAFTSVTELGEFLAPLGVSTTAEFNNLEKEKLNERVREISPFSSWREMIDTALGRQG